MRANRVTGASLLAKNTLAGRLFAAAAAVKSAIGLSVVALDASG